MIFLQMILYNNVVLSIAYAKIVARAEKIVHDPQERKT